jgi:hypothetical protein
LIRIDCGPVLSLRGHAGTRKITDPENSSACDSGEEDRNRCVSTDALAEIVLSFINGAGHNDKRIRTILLLKD